MDQVKGATGEVNKVVQEFINFAENTFQESSTHGDSLYKPYNIDPLYRKNGDYSIHEDMMRDDQISVNMQMKKDIILGPGWEIKANDDNQDEIIDDLTKALTDDVDKPLENQLDEVITAFDYGFSLSEKIFKRREDNSVSFKTLKTRHPDTWTIYTDNKGNVTKYEQHGPRGDEDIKANTLIHYVNNGKFQNPYGNSDLVAAYIAWFAKKEFIKYFAIFGEKSASPIPIGKYPKNTKEDEKNLLLKILKKFQIKSALVVPKEMEIEFLESKNNGDFYDRAINMFNMFIGRALFIPDLLGMQGGETSGGSYSLGEKQLELFFLHIGRRRKYIEWIMNKHIIKPILLNNWGKLDKPPIWKLKPISEEDVFQAAKLWIEATKSRIYRPSDEEINKFRNIINFPEGEVEKAEEPTEPMPPTDDKPDNGAEEIKDDIEEAAEEEKEQKNFAFKMPSGDYHKKVDFKKIGGQLDSKLNLITASAEPIVDFIINDYLEQAEKKKIIPLNRVEKIKDIKIRKMKDIKVILKNALRENFKEAKIQANSELFKRDFTPPLPSEEFLKVLDEETFEFIGDWAYNISKQGRIEMVSAIKDGRPLSSVIDLMKANGKKDAMVSLERYARTKLTETLNRGRQEFFESSGAVAGYQYSAIMDDRTTAICSGLHGKKFKAGTEPLPPMHFNCRSILIPITYLEDFTPTSEIKGESPDAFIEQNLGKGFSKS